MMFRRVLASLLLISTLATFGEASGVSNKVAVFQGTSLEQNNNTRVGGRAWIYWLNLIEFLVIGNP